MDGPRPDDPAGGRPGDHSAGGDLVVERTVDVTVHDAWVDLTFPGRLAQWYGTVDRRPQVGETLLLALVHEEGDPVEEVNVLACDEPHLLSVDQAGWRVAVHLVDLGQTTLVRLVHHIGPADDRDEAEAWWSRYLDRFATLRG